MRYVAKLLGSVLYFKPVITVVQEIELPLLFYGVKHLLDAYSDIPAPDTNVAAVLCDTLVKMKNNVPTSAAKSILAGIAITPLFLGCNLDLSRALSSIKRERMDLIYLIHTSFTKPRSRLYQFLGRDGNTYFCRISNQHIIHSSPRRT